MPDVIFAETAGCRHRGLAAGALLMGSAARLARAATVGVGQNPTSVRLARCTRALDAVFDSCECHETDKSRELSGSRKRAVPVITAILAPRWGISPQGSIRRLYIAN